MTLALELSDYGPRLLRGLETIPIVDATPDAVLADVRRGRRARTMRRVRRTVANAVIVSAVATIASVLAPDRSRTPTHRPVGLVAYHGAQPSGLTVDVAPSRQPVHLYPHAIRWGSGSMTLLATLLPPNAIPFGSTGRPVDAGNGRIGWIISPPATASPSAVLRVLVAVADGRLIEIDASDGLHWTDAELALFASHVTLAPARVELTPVPARSDQPVIAVTTAAGG
jgi:hypothetical protein